MTVSEWMVVDHLHELAETNSILTQTFSSRFAPLGKFSVSPVAQKNG